MSTATAAATQENTESQATQTHPCYTKKAHHTHGRVHVPVAPKCNVQCGFCSRKFDCINESRPGVTSSVLKPEQAAWYVDSLRAIDDRLSVVGIAGPGDPAANPDATLKTFRLIKEQQPDMTLCMSSNGLALANMVNPLRDLGMSHMTITINAIDPDISSKIYTWIRDGDDVLRGEAAGRRMVIRQQAALRKCIQAGMTVKVNSLLIPGINDEHIEDIAKFAAEIGAARFNMIPLLPVEGTPLAAQGEPDAALIKAKRQACGQHLKQMTHCARCRADAAGMLGKDHVGAMSLLKEASKMPTTDSEPTYTPKPYVAVASREGVLVNVHLGHADRLAIFAEESDHFRLVDVRKTPDRGLGMARWEKLAEVLHDCRAVVSQEAGSSPEKILGKSGIRVLTTEGMVEDALELVFGGQEAQMRPPSCSSGPGCDAAARCSGGGGGMCA